MLKNEIEIPEGLDVVLENGRLIARGANGEISRVFKNPRISLKVESRKIVITSDTERRKVRATVWTWDSHIRNMFLGLKRGWKGELKLVYSHFPVKLKLEGNRLLIENFLGEREPRTVPVPEDLKVEIDKNVIHVSGKDKEKIGHLCARIEQITKVKGYDRRIFQDGIYITRKPYLEGESER